LVINNLDSKPTVLRNVTSNTGHWLNIRLVGDPAKQTPKDAIGTVVYLTTGKIRQRLDVISGAGYCSQNEMTLHFGLGAATKVDKLEIKWAGGHLEKVDVPSIDKTMTIIEGQVRK
jgi:enediyne biosynthesis protein E4